MQSGIRWNWVLSLEGRVRPFWRTSAISHGPTSTSFSRLFLHFFFFAHQREIDAAKRVRLSARRAILRFFRIRQRTCLVIGRLMHFKAIIVLPITFNAGNLASLENVLPFWFDHLYRFVHNDWPNVCNRVWFCCFHIIFTFNFLRSQSRRFDDAGHGRHSGLQFKFQMQLRARNARKWVS